MEGTKRLRSGIRLALRIVSSLPGIAGSVLLIAIWIRSYWWVDKTFLQILPHVAVYVNLTPGHLGVWSMSSQVAWPVGDSFKYSFPVDEFFGKENPDPYKSVTGTFSLRSGYLVVPLWFPILISAALAGTPWIRWSRRFSLAALLGIVSLAAVFIQIVITVHLSVADIEARAASNGGEAAEDHELIGVEAGS